MPWKELEIPATNDVRAIKRAYAQKLKRHRPDDDPEGFQQLHRAYKQALQLAEMADERTTFSDQSDIPFSEAEYENPEEEMDWSGRPEHDSGIQPMSVEEDGSDTDRHPLLDSLVEECKHCLSRTQGLSDPGAWSFLSTTPELLDSDFNHQLGQAVFNAIDDKERCSGVKPHPAVLRYLNHLFNWTGKRQLYYLQFGESGCDWIFQSLDSETNSNDLLRGVRGGDPVEPTIQSTSSSPQLDYASYAMRSLAFLTDLFFLITAIALLIVGPYNLLYPDDPISDFWLLVSTPPAYLLLVLIMECSPLQATPGKYLLGMTVVNRFGMRLPLWHNLLRVLAFTASGLLWKVIFVLNAFLKGRLLHDRISNSFVVRKRSMNS